MPLLRLRILRTLAVFLLFFVLGSTLPLDPARGARRELRLGGFAGEVTLPATSIAPGHPVMTGQAGLRRSEAGAIMGTGNHEGLGRSNRA